MLDNTNMIHNLFIVKYFHFQKDSKNSDSDKSRDKNHHLNDGEHKAKGGDHKSGKKEKKKKEQKDGSKSDTSSSSSSSSSSSDEVGIPS